MTAGHFYRQSRLAEVRRGGRPAAIDSPSRKPAGSPVDIPGEKKGPHSPVRENSQNFGQLAPQPSPPGPEAKLQANGPDKKIRRPTLPGISRNPGPQNPANPAKEPTPADDASLQPNNAIRRTGPARAAAEISAPSKGNGESENLPAKPGVKTKEGAGGKAPPSDTYAETPALIDGRLKVHAIAWSPMVEERMAVVNNRVVYEGDSVDSFVVVAIRPDDVVVREKDKGLWKVAFGRP